MARYIDAEPIINRIESEIKYFGEPNISNRLVAFGAKNALQSVLGVVNSQPTADVEEVVRCKDCKCCELCYPAKAIGEDALEGWYCKIRNKHMRPDDFCSYGERKQKNDFKEGLM